MRNFEIIAFGRLSDSFIAEGCKKYIERMRPMARLTVTELPAAALHEESEASIARALDNEARAALKIIPDKAAVVAMCIEGDSLSSTELSAYVEKAFAAGRGKVIFLIGSSHGMSEELKKRADLRLSMSPMTFPHELARLMLCEQLYRAVSIACSTKYHK